MTDSAALLVEINQVLRDELPGTTQVVRRRIAAGIHRKLKEIITTKDEEIAELSKTIARQAEDLSRSNERSMRAVRSAAAQALKAMEKIYGEETKQPH